ncbi:MAG: hypothetical protein A3A97_01085 [Candidatus Terrybacteria bacterium RIFCSPLOWO2_01_FULL_40_23]|uniref:Uncharacterized protein n=1 Tax=Candidatus Terrybacteria bacterium RIFCSPLOWO2_01_FULL_40_23 TaxID=1802366 RepID=A0A1G2PY70_9BACT|nr:MAG: hypothetical protein A3A97_01085 [Candidatus Terrybacteria bacterium RIFCSPLOWO2_01_FULL_40_23]
MKPGISTIQTPYILVQDENDPRNGQIAMVLGIKTITPTDGKGYQCLLIKFSDWEHQYVPLSEIIGVAENPKYHLLSPEEIYEFKTKPPSPKN